MCAARLADTYGTIPTFFADYHVDYPLPLDTIHADSDYGQCHHILLFDAMPGRPKFQYRYHASDRYDAKFPGFIPRIHAPRKKCNPHTRFVTRLRGSSRDSPLLSTESAIYRLIGSQETPPPFFSPFP